MHGVSSLDTGVLYMLRDTIEDASSVNAAGVRVRGVAGMKRNLEECEGPHTSQVKQPDSC